MYGSMNEEKNPFEKTDFENMFCDLVLLAQIDNLNTQIHIIRCIKKVSAYSIR